MKKKYIGLLHPEHNFMSLSKPNFMGNNYHLSQVYVSTTLTLSFSYTPSAMTFLWLNPKVTTFTLAPVQLVHFKKISNLKFISSSGSFILPIKHSTLPSQFTFLLYQISISLIPSPIPSNIQYLFHHFQSDYHFGSYSLGKCNCIRKDTPQVPRSICTHIPCVLSF